MAKHKAVYNLDRVLTELRKRRAKAGLDGLSKVSVGYSAPYAVPVHERMDVFHPVGQAKFLDQPIRTEAKPMARIVTARLRARETLVSAQLAAAKHLMSVSLRLVPVDTGYLKDSWFIRPTQRGV